MLPAGGHAGTVRGALTWLVSQKGPAGTWPSTQATVLALKALLAGTGKLLNGDRERRILITWGTDKPREVVIPADQAEVVQQIDLSAQLTPGTHRLELSEPDDAATAFQLAFRYPVPGGPPEKAEPLAIDLASDRTDVTLGDTVTATVENRRGLEPAKALRLRYRLRTTMPVQVTAPAARAYEYYDPDKQGHTRPVRLTVAPRPN